MKPDALRFYFTYFCRKDLSNSEHYTSFYRQDARTQIQLYMLRAFAVKLF